MKKIKCPVCGLIKTNLEIQAIDPRNAEDNKLYDFYRCRSCKSLFLIGVKYSKKYYKNSYGEKYYKKNNSLKNSLEKLYINIINEKKKNILLKYADRYKQKLLDVGSGNLSFLLTLNSNNYSRSSIDIGSRAEHVKDINIINADFLKYDFRSVHFDIITAWHVIEHIPNPSDFVQKIKTILNNKGYAIISTPIIDSLGYKIAKNHWYHLDTPRHTTIFSQKALVDLFNKYGFENIYQERILFEFPFDILKSVLKSRKYFYLLIYPFLKLMSRETMIFVFKKK